MILENIKSLCSRNKVSIAELERSVGIGNGVISTWDKGRPRVDKIKAVADYFGVTVDWLLEAHDSSESTA